MLSHAQQVSPERLSQWWQVAGRPLSFVRCSFTFFRLQLYPVCSLLQDSTSSIRFGGYKLQDNGWILKRRGVKGNWALSVILALCFSGTLCVSSADWTRRLQPSSSWALRWGLWYLDTFQTGLMLFRLFLQDFGFMMITSQTRDPQKIRGADKGENSIVKGESILSHENWIKVILGSNADHGSAS